MFFEWGDNMKKFIISIVAIISIIVLSLMFKDITISESDAFPNSRFIEVDNDGGFKIYCDTTTKVLYLQSTKGSGYQGYGGLTLLVDKDGKPLLYND